MDAEVRNETSNRSATHTQADNAPQSPSVGEFFTPTRWALFTLIVLIGIAFRWYDLDARPVHHDESLHLYYGRNFFENPDTQYYKYDPMLHGPFLYNMLRGAYSLFGTSTWGGRAPIALIGSLALFLPLLFRRYFSPTAVIALTAAVAFSPTLTYWSRFIREDPGMIAASLLLLYACTLAPKQRAWMYGIISVALQFVQKENIFVAFAILAGFLVYEALFAWVMKRRGETPLMITRAWRTLKDTWPHALVGLVLGGMIFWYFYSAGFRFNQGPESFVTKSFNYWFVQHANERIKGPFNFHLYVLTWYELPFLLATLGSFWLMLRTGVPVIRWLTVASWVLATALALIFATRNIEQNLIWGFFKLKDNLDVFGLVILLTHPVLITTHHLLRRERTLALWGYLFFASLFTYSYLGEKVPWLNMYAFIPGLIYLALLFDKHFASHPLPQWRTFPVDRLVLAVGSIIGALGVIFCLEEGFSSENLFWIGSGAAVATVGTLGFIPGLLGQVNLARVAFVAFSLWSIRQSFLTNVVFAGDAREYISQVHTTHEFQDIPASFVAQQKLPVNGVRPRLCLSGDSAWPGSWYFYGMEGYRFREKSTPQSCAGFEYQLVDFTGTAADDLPGYTGLNIRLRGWWVPDFKQATVKKMLRYSLNRTIWGESGYSWVRLLALTPISTKGTEVAAAK